MALIFMLGVALITLTTAILFFLVSKKPSNLPPGQNGWPIIGETFGFASHPAKFIRDRMTKHCPYIFQTSIGGEKVVFFCGASSNKFIYSNEAKFKNWVPRSIAKALSLVNTDIKSPQFELFKEQVHKFLKVESLRDYVSVMDTKAREHMATHWVPYNEVKVQPLTKEFGLSLACHVFMGFNMDEVREIAKSFYTFAERIISVPVNLPGTSYNQALKASKVVQGKLIDLIRKRKSELLSKVDVIDGQDLLSRVLLASGRQENYSISDEELAGQINIIIFAGFNTTSTAITFSLCHLAEYPDVYAKVLHEQMDIAQSKGEGELLTLKDIQKMKYTWNVVCESVRLKPPSIGGFREADNDISYAGFTVPKGSKVHWNVYSTHMDPKYFPNPEKFDPSRFEEIFPPRVFVPFGGGPHMCPGREFARIKILIYLHNVVTRFRLTKVNPDEKVIYRPDPVLVEGLRIRLQSHAK